MKIYTKTGDKSNTTLFGGQRVSKGDIRVEACGTIDELNSQLGVILSGIDLSKPGLTKVKLKLERIQEELFVAGSDLATPLVLKLGSPRVKKSFVSRLEKEIDGWEKELPALKNFILPGGSKTAARIHLARAVARRAERCVVMLNNTEEVNPYVLIYLNRLSDWLFTLARYVNKIEGQAEKVWEGRG